MKKIIAAALAFSMSVSTVAFSFDGFEDVPGVVTTRDKAIFYLAEKGILTGYPDNFFYAERNITRAEMATVIYKAMHGLTEPDNTELSRFSDVSENYWARGYINQAVKDKIVNGIDAQTFAPDENVTNEQAIKMIVCMKEMQAEAEERGGYPKGYVLTAVRTGILDDVEIVYSDTGEDSFQGSYAKRGDIAIMVYNALKE